jgi:CheY-like chemotaxis protein
MFRQLSGRAHPVPRRMTAVAGKSIPPGLMAGRLLREAQNFARVMAGRPQRRPKDPSTSVQKTSATRAVRSRNRRGGGRRSVGSRCALEIDIGRRVQGSDFRRPSALFASAISKADACLAVDLNLPEMNGMGSSLTASGRGLPSVMITDRNDPAAQRLIEEAHPVAALFKPVDERTVFDAIARALARSSG